MFGIRTWKVFADKDNFLGYEYARDQDEVHAKAAKKFGVPEGWGITSYTVELIAWPTDT